MLCADVNDILSKMNECGRKKRPFLFAVNFEMTEGFIIENPLTQSDVLFEVNGVGNIPPIEKGKGVSTRFEYQPLPYTDYKKRFEIVHNGLKKGDSYLTNLTVKTPVSFDLPI